MSHRTESEPHTKNDTEAVAPEHKASLVGTLRAETVTSNTALASAPSPPLLSEGRPLCGEGYAVGEPLSHFLAQPSLACKIKAQPMPAVSIRPRLSDYLGGNDSTWPFLSPSCLKLVSGTNSLPTALWPGSNIASYSPSHHAYFQGFLRISSLSVGNF